MSGAGKHLGESPQGGEACAALDAHPVSISPGDVHVRMLACSEHGQWAVLEGLAMGHSALRSTAGCFVGSGAGQEGMVWEAHLELCFRGGLLLGPYKFTASPAPALPAWLLLSCLGVCLSSLIPRGCPWSWKVTLQGIFFSPCSGHITSSYSSHYEVAFFLKKK